MSKLAKESGRQKQLMTKEARDKAIKKISIALTGRTMPEKQKEAIRKTMKENGHQPPPDHIRFSGSDHWNWKGGYSSIRNKLFHEKIYTETRDERIKKDGGGWIDY